MSLATRPLPLAVWPPPIAQLLLPGECASRMIGSLARCQRRELTRMLAQVVDVRARHRRRGDHLPVDGRLPLRRYRIDETEERWRQAGLEHAAAQIGLGAAVVQLQVHGEDHEHRVARLPMHGTRSQQEILERPDAEALETGVDTGRIGVDQFALALRQRRIHAIGKSLEPVQAIAPVGRQGRIADELRQSSGGHPPRQVHLEVTILCVHIAGRVGDVVAARPRDRGDPECVALDRDRRREPRRGDPPVDCRQAAAQGEHWRRDRHRDDRHGDDDDPVRLPHQSPGGGQSIATDRTVAPHDTSRIFIVFVPPATPDSSPIVRMIRSPRLA